MVPLAVLVALQEGEEEVGGGDEISSRPWAVAFGIAMESRQKRMADMIPGATGGILAPEK